MECCESYHNSALCVESFTAAAVVVYGVLCPCLHRWCAVCVCLLQTNLQGCLDAVLAATAALNNLTHLAVECAPVQDTDVLQQLPASLLQLALVLSDNDRDIGFDMGHLTAVTRLSLSAGAEDRFHILDNDVLPPNVQVLQMPGNRCITPVLALRGLRELYFNGSLVLADALQALSSLHALTGVWVQYEDFKSKLEQAMEGARAWGKVPLVTGK